MAKQSRSTALIGASGEHYVAGYLSGYELIVAVPRGGIAGCDLLVTNEFKGRAIRLQVKTGTQATRNTKLDGNIFLWSTSYKVIEQNDTQLWYSYVWLNGWPKSENIPEVFFVPSTVVIDCLQACRDSGDTWPYFWLRTDDAQQYRGNFAALEEVRHQENRKDAREDSSRQNTVGWLALAIAFVAVIIAILSWIYPAVSR